MNANQLYIYYIVVYIYQWILLTVCSYYIYCIVVLYLAMDIACSYYIYCIVVLYLAMDIACSYYIYCIVVLYLAVDLPPEEQIPSMVRNRNMPAINP